VSGSGLELTELELDALTELVNIGVSRAAASLRKMIGMQVLLSVPSIEIVPREVAAQLIGVREDSRLVAVHQDFAGAFSGNALLIFPERSSLELVRGVTGGELAEDELAGMEEEALAETGNIILNSCLATMANMLQRSLNMSLPSVVRGSGPELFQATSPALPGSMVLFLYINFSVQDRDIRGYIAMLMDLPSLASLKVLVGAFIERVAGVDAVT
jgi:chemotaxis protein CheC